MKTQIKPIKRSAELVPLSRDHHHGLLLCWKIRTGIQHAVDAKRIQSYVLHFFQEVLERHFDEEEKIVFKLLPDNNPLKIEALAQHDILRGMIKTIAEKPADLRHLLEWFADQLMDHIRFEERKLFPYIEKNAGRATLANAGQVISRLEGPRAPAIWRDEFWAVKKEK